MKPLYAITDDYLAALEAAYEAAEDGTGIVSEEMVERITRMEVSLKEKLEGCCAARANMQERERNCEWEEKRLKSQRQTLERNRKWLEGYVREQLERAGIEKTTAGTWRLSICKNSTDTLTFSEDTLPGDYWRTPPKEPDTDGIRSAIKAGVEIPGAALTRGTHLRIA